MKNKSLLNYYDACNKLVLSFVKKYFDDNADFRWIADNVGGVLHVNDYFFSMDQIVSIMEIKPTWEWLEEVYHGFIEDQHISFENYLKYGLKKLSS